ncbi:MAG: GNAT family N-acetyltransferase [Anaerolineae bacterium]|nr:GNAT family N-acetyltransferase [Anaerolineae bacterium]
MPARPFKLPADLSVMADLIPPCFQYPENEAWSIQEDEVENWVDTINGIRRIWPLFRLIQLIVPPMRDAMRGFIWEEDGKAVGLCNVIRKGFTDQWLIGNVAVLPDYRRRGIARQLVQACLDYARGRGSEVIVLDVLAGNVPAYSLYEKLGFEHYSGETQLLYDSPDLLDEVPLPGGYTLEQTSLFAWRPRYELAQRITPDTVKRYAPVEEGTYRQPAIFRLLFPVLIQAMGSRPAGFLVRRAGGGQVVASIGYNARLREGGINDISANLDPAHADLAPFLVRYLVRAVMAAAPGRRIEFSVKHWQEPLLPAALEAGFEQRCEMHSMGLIL